MLFRTVSMVVSLTITAAFFGWVRSSNRSTNTTRLDELFTLNTQQSGKKERSSRPAVAEATRR